jgi:hypothetical protein
VSLVIRGVRLIYAASKVNVMLTRSFTPTEYLQSSGRFLSSVPAPLSQMDPLLFG